LRGQFNVENLFSAHMSDAIFTRVLGLTAFITRRAEC
jgi:hypothetical protein